MGSEETENLRSEKVLGLTMGVVPPVVIPHSSVDTNLYHRVECAKQRIHRSCQIFRGFIYKWKVGLTDIGGWPFGPMQNTSETARYRLQG